ncbi:hypothetical protein E3J74_05080 [Candidatus Bathyarchaeota archaeon]|nr:MAG: hypothetical protein E3J74_05080 [Candidatus Bathyarchaeota archaeon]
MPKVEIELGTLTNTCFIIMPFNPTFQSEYESIIRPAVEAVKLTPIRADEIYSRPRVTADIWKGLRSARIVIAELTGKNTNVFYEVGLAHSLGKPVIIITRNQDDVPFDLKALRYVYYDIDDPFWGENLKKALIRMLENVLKEKEYGTVFKGITVSGKIQYEKRKSPKKTKAEKPYYHLTGIWQGEMKVRQQTYNCNLHLVQTDGKLSGTMTISWTDEEELSVVQEAMVGEIMEDSLSLRGVSYSYLQQGASPGYNPDVFMLKVASDGNEISGPCDDTKGRKGTVKFWKRALKRNKAEHRKPI